MPGLLHTFIRSLPPCICICIPYTHTSMSTYSCGYATPPVVVAREYAQSFTTAAGRGNAKYKKALKMQPGLQRMRAILMPAAKQKAASAPRSSSSSVSCAAATTDAADIPKKKRAPANRLSSLATRFKKEMRRATPKQKGPITEAEMRLLDHTKAILEHIQKTPDAELQYVDTRNGVRMHHVVRLNERIPGWLSAVVLSSAPETNLQARVFHPVDRLPKEEISINAVFRSLFFLTEPVTVI
jgi:hypothetical protein